ncbi:MAG: hypothetical protein Q6K92_04895 [Thermostichus sp. DG_1_5_bins_95]
MLPRLPAKCSSGETLGIEGRTVPDAVNVHPPPPRPILKLQGLQATLCVELIQSVAPGSQARSGSPAMLWVRPLLLQQGSQVWHLRSTADLLWPAARFVPAYAEEVLPWLEQARDPEDFGLVARQLLQEFLRQAWQQLPPS